MKSLVLMQIAAESISTPNPFLLGLLWVFAIYLVVLGSRLVVKTRGDARNIGIGLLLAVFCWAGINVGWEYSISVFFHDSEKSDSLTVPLLRTFMELGFVFSGCSLAVMALSDLCIVIYGSDLVRLQKALLRFGFWVVGLSIIYQIHFASQYSIKAVVIGIGGALVFILGLGLQRTLTNLFSGFDLQADKVFAKGDMIQIGVKGVEGVVWDTSLRSTRIHTLDGQMLIISNGELLTKEVLNLDQPTRALRVRRTIGISYATPPMRAKDVMLQVLKHDSDVLDQPAPSVHVISYGDSSINYELRFWVADRRTMDENIDSVLTRIWYALNESTIEIPFPIRSVRMVDMKSEAEHSLAEHDRVAKFERHLAACPLFSEQYMSKSERNELARDAHLLRLEVGELAVRFGEQSDHMYLIIAGDVRVMLKGKEPIELHTSQAFGEMALLLDQPRSADVVAGPNGVTLLRLAKVSVLPVLNRRPEFAKEIRQVSTKRRIASGIEDEKHIVVSRRDRLIALVSNAGRSLKPW